MKRNSESRARRRPAILIFGENPNDSESIKTLIGHFNRAASETFDILTRRDPPSLTHHAKPPARKDWLDRIEKAVRTEQSIREIRAVVVHQDSDMKDHAGTVEAQLRGDLVAKFPNRATLAAVPIQMIEAWWLLFPAAIRTVRPQAWREAKFPSGDTESIGNPKQALIRATAKVAPKHPYCEGDSRTIAKAIAKLNLAPQGRNASWERFMADIKALI